MTSAYQRFLARQRAASPAAPIDLEPKFEAGWADFAAHPLLRDHWRWWEDYRKLRDVFAFQLSLPGLGGMLEARAPGLADALAACDALDPLPPAWWHVPVLPAGLLAAWDISWPDVERIYLETSGPVRRRTPISARVGRLTVLHTSVALELDDGGRIRELRGALRQAYPYFDQAGRDPDYDGQTDRFLPRAPLAFTRVDALRSDVRELLARFRDVELGTVTFRELRLVRYLFHERERFADVEEVAVVRLAGDET